MLLTVKNLNISFKHDSETAKAAAGVSFNVSENEIVGIVGESGSGKTVTALSIMKLLPRRDCIATGEIVSSARIAMVFQEPFTCLNPVLRVGEQIDEAVLIRRQVSKSGARARTIHLLGKVKIHDPERIYRAYPHQLSGGERQRAMIAMALALEPGLLIADEPTTALDVTTQAEILELLLQIKKEMGMSVIFITHDFGIIRRIADRVIVMKEGRIVEEAGKKEIFENPKNEYTKKLLDAVPEITFGGKESGERRESVITVSDISKSFSVEGGVFMTEKTRVEAVSGVSLEIEKGKTLGVVGESGSGKTTLGRLIIGLIRPDSGEVKGDRKKTQIVFQDPYSSLDPRMRMRDIVLEGPAIKGLSAGEKEKTLKSTLSRVRLDYKDILKYPHQFSGGQRQRIAIARSLAVGPEIIILDEPVSSLDVIIQKEILDLLKKLQDELSLTYIFISHDLRVVEYMADSIAVMQKGRIVESGSSRDIYNSPRHPYTKKLISSAF